MVTLNPYLNYPGNAEEAFTHYKKIFGGEYNIVRFKDAPSEENVTDAEKEKAMHIALPIGRGNVLMATDLVGKRMEKFNPGNDHYLSLFVDSDAEADKIFAGLAEGGSIQLPMSQQFWGAYFGMLTDKWGVRWMINHDHNQDPHGK